MRKQFFLCTALLVTACQPDITDQTQPLPLNSGTADFSRYVAIGDGLSVGYQNNALSQSGQTGSFPNLLAHVFSQAGGGAFIQPTLSRKYAGPLLNNLGVPGLRLGDVQLTALAQTNPFFERLLPAGQEKLTYISWLKSQVQPTFFTVWLGFNDAFDFVTSGGTRPATELSVFTENLHLLLDGLLINGAKGVLANLPDPTMIPLLTTRTFTQLRDSTRRTMYIQTGYGTVRLATDDDLLLTTADSVGIANASGVPKGFVAAYPLANEDVLDRAEVQAIQAVVSAYNKAIIDLATARQLPVMNINSLYRRLQVPTSLHSEESTGNHGADSFFSSDAVCPGKEGYAVIANEFVRVINAYYGSSVSFL